MVLDISRIQRSACRCQISEADHGDPALIPDGIGHSRFSDVDVLSAFRSCLQLEKSAEVFRHQARDAVW